MITKLQTFLYPLYKASSSSTHFIFSRVTSLGAMMLVLLPIITAIFLAYFKLATLSLLVILIGVFSFSFLMLWVRGGKIEVQKRRLPKHATVGSELFYSVDYFNLSPKALNSAIIHDLPQDSRPTKHEFITSREPLESNRNVFDRIFAYYRWLWLASKKMKFESIPKVLPPLSGGEQGSLSLSCTPLRRGKLIFQNMRLFMPDPLCLLQRSSKVNSSDDSVLVLPKRYKLPDLVLDGDARDHSGGRSYSSISGMSDDFRGLRSYRPGDPIKHIDWGAWARTGKPVIREYENVFFPRYALVLDTNGSYENSERFEEAISIAASFASAVDTQECLIDLMFLNQGVQTVTVGKGVAKSEKLLESLATLEVELEPDWRSLSEQVLRHASSFSSCIVIFNELTDERLDLINEWRSSGLNLLILVIVSEAESSQDITNAGAIPIRENAVQQDLLKLL